MSADPRTLAAKLRNDLLGVVTYGDVIDAADLVEQVVVPLHDAWLKAKPPCPTCDGEWEATWDQSDDCQFAEHGYPEDCPDCSDGVQPFDKWTAGLAALWTAVHDRGDEVVACSGEQVFAFLRQIRGAR